MRVNNIVDVAALIVVVAGVTTVVSHPESAKVISAIGSTFAGSIRAALGK